VRSPDLIETVDPSVDRWHRSRASGSRHSGFQTAGTWESWTREPRTPEGDVAGGTRRHSGTHVIVDRDSGFGKLESRGFVTSRLPIFPIGKIPRVGRLTR
jgi:hypothetical protein